MVTRLVLNLYADFKGDMGEKKKPKQTGAIISLYKVVILTLDLINIDLRNTAQKPLISSEK